MLMASACAAAWVATVWQALDSGEWRHLSEDDITSLRGMVTRWRKGAQQPDP